MTSGAGGSPNDDRNARALPASKAIIGSSRQFPVLDWLVSVILAGVVAFLAFEFQPIPGRAGVATFAFAAFAVAALALLWNAVRTTLRWYRFRGLSLEIDPYPAQAGGVLGGSLVVPVAYDSASRFDLVLSCKEYGRLGGTLQRGNRYERELFREEAQARKLPAPGGTRLTFRLAIPREAPASDSYGEGIAWGPEAAKRIYVRWALYLSAKVEGVDVLEGFEIPVRRLAEGEVPRGELSDFGAAPSGSSPSFAPAATAADSARQESGTLAYTYERIGNGVRVTQPAWRKPLEVTSLSSLVLGFGSAIAFMAMGWFIFSESQRAPGALFFLIGAAFAALYLGYLAHSLTVEVNDAGIRIERRVFGIRVRQESLPRDDIEAVVASAEGQVAKTGSMVTRKVMVRMRDGSEYSVAELIPRERDALVVRDLIASRLGVEAAGCASVAQPSAHDPAASGGAPPRWLKTAGLVLLLFLTLVEAWPYIREYVGFGVTQPVVRPAMAPRTSLAQQPAVIPVETYPPVGATDWQSRFEAGSRAASGERPHEAIRHYQDVLAYVESAYGANDPLAAVMLERIGSVHVSGREYALAEPALRRALAIIEPVPHEQVRARVGTLAPRFDREKLERDLAWVLWELRRYPEALAHYQSAYTVAAHLNLDENDRNRRLAYGSAGIMVNACRLSQWEIADRAMAELKQRMQALPDHDRQWLQYWVRTGEPRLASRRC